MSGHTPGPWVARDHKDRTLKVASNLAVHSPQNATVAVMVIGGFFAKADARLIAAAPELFEALCMASDLVCSSLCGKSDEHDHQEACVVARKAIAKAEANP